MTSVLPRSLAPFALICMAASLLTGVLGAQPAEPAQPQPAAGEATAAERADEPYDEPTVAPRAPRAPQVDEVLAACVRSFGAAQKLRRGGKLMASRRQLTQCAQPRCPSVLADRCVQWHREVAAAIPSIVVAAKDPAGRDTLDVRVSVDGTVVAALLDGRGIELDPGMHVLRFEHQGSPVVRRMLVLTEGEKHRRMRIEFSKAPAGWHAAIAPPDETPGAAPSEEQPLWPLVIGSWSVGAAGLIVGTATGIAALSEQAALVDSCTDNLCPNELRDDYRRATTLANVSTLGFIAAGVGTTVGFVAFIATRKPAPESSEQATGAVRLAIGHGNLILSGRF